MENTTKSEEKPQSTEPISTEGGDKPEKVLTEAQKERLAKKKAHAIEKGLIKDKGERPPSQAKPGKVIIRNIQFDLLDKHLKNKFQMYGRVIEASVPKKEDSTSNQNRGFGFVEFESREVAQKAVDALNNKEWKGRKITVDFSVPKLSYEHKIGKVVEHTGLAREEAILPKALRDEKKVAQEVKDKQAEEKKEYEEKNAAKIRKQDKKKAKKLAQKKEDKKEFEDTHESESLFVRNIGFDTTQAQFARFMEKFGPVKFALLCKTNEFNGDPDLQSAGPSQPSHKGTGFVKFKTKAPAAQLLELSKKVEEHLDEERRNSRLKKDVKKSLVSSLTLLQNEIELNGRRLIVKSSVTKDEASVLREKQIDEQKRKKLEEDKRNLGMAKEGLLNEDHWIHQEPPLEKSMFELRQRLYIAKEKALKGSTNLYISHTRLQVRNLPRKEFAEPELKQLMRVVSDEWAKTLSLQERKELWKNKKLISHVKIMKDEQKTDTVTGEALPSGQGFVEFTNQDLALYAVNYLNNMEIVTKKGLIVDFSMEDQRALFKRKEKIERWRKIAKEKKDDDDAILKEQEDSIKKFSKNEPMDLGQAHNQDQAEPEVQQSKSEKPKKDKKDKQHHGKMGIKDVEDVNKLKNMLNETVSRGMKQRIKKKIARLATEKAIANKGVQETSDTNQVSLSGMTNPNQKATISKFVQTPDKQHEKKLSAREKIDNIMKKRDKKLEEKNKQASPKALLTVEDKKIMSDLKNKKREQRRDRSKADNDDEFDALLNNYKSKVLKKLDHINKVGESGASFEEVEYSD